MAEVTSALAEHANDDNVPGPSTHPARKRKAISYKEDDGDDADTSQPKPKRARRAKKVVEDSDDDDDSESLSDDTNNSPKKRARKTKTPVKKDTSVKPRKSRAKKKRDSDDDEGSPNQKGSDAEAGEPKKPKRRGRPKKAPATQTEDADGRASLDPTMTTMADICADPGVGRPSKRSVTISQDFASAKARDKERRAEALDREVRRMYGEVVDGDPPPVQPQLSLKENDKEDGDDFDYDQSVSLGGHHAPQVRIGADGQVMVDEQSLQVDRSEAPEHRMDENQMTHIEENDHNRFINSQSHSRKAPGRRWSKEETELFYNALQQCGTDFQLIGLLLGTRPRHQIKLKFNREDKLNPDRVAWCLKNPIPIDLETLSAKTKRSFDGPVPQYGPSEEQMAQAAARASSAPSSRKATREPSEVPAAGKGRAKKSRRAGLPEGMEVVSTIEDFVDDEEENEK